MFKRIFFFYILLLNSAVFAAVPFPVTYVRHPITAAKPRINDIEKQNITSPGSCLMLVQPDGTEEVLVDPGALGGILDPAVSLDGQWIYYSQQASAKSGLEGVVSASDIFKINIATKQVVQLTFSEKTYIGLPNTWPPHNLGACPIPGGKVIFESSRNSIRGSKDTSTRFFFEPTLQLYVMDEDGSNVEQVGHLNLGGVRHPTLLKDGRIMWATGESHGLRSAKHWGLWASKPDGRTWEPLWSAMSFVTADLSSLHWQSQTADGHIQLVYYYPIQQAGYGNLFDFLPGQGFGEVKKTLNPTLKDKSIPGLRFPLQPIGAKSLTPWATGKDAANTAVSHPSGAPGGLLLSLATTATDASGAGGTMKVRTAGIYFLPGPAVAVNPTDLTVVINNPSFLATQPRAVVPVENIFGVVPPEIEWIPNPSATPFGYVGTSSVYARESAPLNRLVSDPADIWGQGGDVGTYNNSDIYAIRILLQNPTPKEHFSLNANKQLWTATGIERLAIAGEIVLHKKDDNGNLILDSTGVPDTSFLAKIPADHSFTFQLIDKNGQVLTHAMTWHQLRPGETRTDCRGCHAHHSPGLVFDGTEASKPTYNISDLTATKPTFVEWQRDVLPIFANKCSECHGTTVQEAGLNLLLKSVRDSKWIRPFRSRTSLLPQRILSEDSSSRMPLGHEPLTPEEIKTICTWIDLGSPVNDGLAKFFVDYQRPTLYVESPKRGPTNTIKFGAFEWQTSIATVSVKADFNTCNRMAGEELSDLATISDNVWTIDLLGTINSGTVTVIVTDMAGQTAKIVRKF